MHFGPDVIAKADRFTRAFEDYRAEHCLLLGYVRLPCCLRAKSNLVTDIHQAVSIKKRPAKRGVFCVDQTAN